MEYNGSFMTRIFVGKGIGFLIGLAGFILLPSVLPEASWMLRTGVLFWYSTMGFVIALVGLFDWKAMTRIALPWWLRAPLVGAWLNFVIVLLGYDLWQGMMQNLMLLGSAFASPWWMVVEGAVIGLIIGFFATRLGGEKYIGIDSGLLEE